MGRLKKKTVSKTAQVCGQKWNWRLWPAHNELYQAISDIFLLAERHKKKVSHPCFTIFWILQIFSNIKWMFGLEGLPKKKMLLPAILKHSGSSRFCKEDPRYSRRCLQAIFSTYFFSILQRRPKIFKEYSPDFLNTFFCNSSTKFVFFILKELIENNILYQQRRPSIFKEFFLAISALL